MFSFRKDNPARRAAGSAYGAVVEHSRQPLFFTDLGVPDTLDGRFELICLHAFLYLRRLKREGAPGEAVSQYFVDLMFADMDRSLREIGTGDLSVGKEVKRMAKAFYGRIAAYETGLQGGDRLLTAALARNLFGTVRQAAPFLDAMTGYLRGAAVQLERQPAEDLLDGRVSFGLPDPRVEAAGEAAPRPPRARP